MEIIGKCFELVGTVITFGGLLYAWWQITKRDNRLRTAVVRSLEAGRRRLTRSETAPLPLEARTVQANDAGAATERQRVFKHEKPLIEHFAEVYQELDAAQDEARANVEAVRREVGDAFTESIIDLKSELDANGLKDLRFALVGIAVTAIGILIGIYG